MNKVILIGNLTRDPELKTTPNGTSVCTFSVAVNRTRTNAAGEREADFFNIVTWQGLAENCGKYLSKGRKVGISGRLQTRTYDDKDGNKRYVTEIVADDVEFIAGRNDDTGSGNYEAPAPRNDNRSSGKKQVSELEPVDNDELPF